MSFDELGLAPELLRAVAAEGYTEPTPVQAEAIPHVLAGRDVLAGAQTGTGKTAAFVLPILQLLEPPTPATIARALRSAPRPRGATGLPIRCLVLTPTRELALQVEEFVKTYGKAEADPLDHDLRRRRLRAADQGHPGRAGDRRRDARPPARHRRAGQDRPPLGRDPRPRRGRPDARHGLHPRHPQDHRAAPAAPPEPDVLGDLRGRRPAARATILHDPAQVQIAPAERRRSSSSARSSIPVDRHRKRELLSQLITDAAGSTGRSSSREPSTARAASPTQLRA